MKRPRWIPLLFLFVAAAVIAAGIALAPEAVRQVQQTLQSPDAAASADAEGKPAPQTASDPDVQAQLDYVLAYWSDYNTDDYGMLDDNDCVNFTSQSLIERGWQMDDYWWTDGTGMDFDYTSSWVSSTSFRDYLEESGRATALSAEQRDKVKLGDVVQFDWDNSGDRDHTGIVTAIEGSGDNITIYFAGHTDDSDFRSVDLAITVDHPGASVYYWSIP